MPTPKTVLMTTAMTATCDGEPQRVHDVGVVEDAAQVVEAVGEGVLADERHRPRDQQEQVGDDEQPEHVGARGAATGSAVVDACAQPRRATLRWMTSSATITTSEITSRTVATAAAPARLSFSMLLRMRTEVTSVVQRQVARQQHQRAVLADAAGERQRGAGGDGRA